MGSVNDYRPLFELISIIHLFTTLDLSNRLQDSPRLANFDFRFIVHVLRLNLFDM